MIVMGKLGNMWFVDGKEFTFESTKSGIFFGGNGAGKTKIFESLNTNIEYQYSKFHKNVFYHAGDDPIFINDEGDLSEIKRDNLEPEFDFGLSKLYSKMSYDVYKKMMIEGDVNPEFVNRTIEIEQDKAFKEIKGDNGFFEYLPYTVNEAKSLIDFMLSKADTWSEKESKTVLDSFLFQFKIYGIEKYFQKEVSKYNDFIQLIAYLKEWGLAYIISERWNIKQTLAFIISKYINEVRSAITRVSKHTKSPAEPKANKIKTKRFLVAKIINGRSLGKDRCNKIINNIISGLKMSNSFVIDDPFDGMDLNTQRIMSEVFAGLIERKVNIIILTNSLSGLRFLKHKNKDLSVFLMMSDTSLTSIENVTQIDNILFKYNSERYYIDLKEFLENNLISYEIRELVLSLHREIFNDSAKVSQFINFKNKYFEDPNIHKLKALNLEVYNGLTETLKLGNSSMMLKSENLGGVSRLSKYMGNITEGKIFSLLSGNLNNDLFRVRYGEILLSVLISKTLIVSLYESAKNKIDHVKEKWSEEFITKTEVSSVLKKQSEILESIKSTRDYIAHPQEHVFVWTLMFDANWSLIYKQLYYIINKMAPELQNLGK